MYLNECNNVSILYSDTQLMEYEKISVLFCSDASLAQSFKPMPKQEGSASDGHVLFVCRRHDHVPVLHIRQAL